MLAPRPAALLIAPLALLLGPSGCGDCSEFNPFFSACPGQATESESGASDVTDPTTTVDCGNGVCDENEDLVSCSKDCMCGTGDSCVCGDTVCGTSESMMSCPQDCTEPFCGNGTVEEGEPCDDGNDVDTDACTNSCTMASCGDGVVWTGEEECDNGPDNGPGKACNAACEANVCGDGDLGPGEMCDDGNSDDTDECAACQMASCGDGFVWANMEACDDGNDVANDVCTNACEPAACGDSIVQDGVEECDDGNAVETDGCLSGCLKPRRVIFVTNALFNGDLNGLGGADMKCKTAATTAELTNAASFKAWLSSEGTSAANRLDTAYLGMYVLTNGSPVAEDGWADLTDGELMHAVDLTETGVKVDVTPWTNTTADGMTAGENDCDGWNNSMAMMAVGRFGFTAATDATWTEANGTVPCSATLPLYCIEGPG